MLLQKPCLHKNINYHSYSSLLASHCGAFCYPFLWLNLLSKVVQSSDTQGIGYQWLVCYSDHTLKASWCKLYGYFTEDCAMFATEM